MAEFISAVLHVLLTTIILSGWAFVFLTGFYDGYPWLAWRDLKLAGRWMAGERRDSGDAKPSLRIVDGGVSNPKAEDDIRRVHQDRGKATRRAS